METAQQHYSIAAEKKTFPFSSWHNIGFKAVSGKLRAAKKIWCAAKRFRYLRKQKLAYN